MHMDMSQEALCAEIYMGNAVSVSRGKHFVRACAVEMHMDMSQEAFCAEIYRENAVRVSRDTHFCASLRSRNAHGHVTRGILRRNLQGKCRTRIPRHPFCASLRSRNAHGHVTRCMLRRNLQGKCHTHIPRHPFCASLRSRNAHGHVTRGILCVEIYRENARRDRYHLDWTPGLHTYRKNPFSVATLFGEKCRTVSQDGSSIIYSHISTL